MLEEEELDSPAARARKAATTAKPQGRRPRERPEDGGRCAARAGARGVGACEPPESSELEELERRLRLRVISAHVGALTHVAPALTWDFYGGRLRR